MLKLGSRIEEYLQFLAMKGFQFGEDAIGFISFGQNYTGSSDVIVKVAIEITLKAQKAFDGSFFISFLEMLKENEVQTKKEAYLLAEQKKLI